VVILKTSDTNSGVGGKWGVTLVVWMYDHGVRNHSPWSHSRLKA